MENADFTEFQVRVNELLRESLADKVIVALLGREAVIAKVKKATMTWLYDRAWDRCDMRQKFVILKLFR